jgi:hypothetical protein
MLGRILVCGDTDLGLGIRGDYEPWKEILVYEDTGRVLTSTQTEIWFIEFNR